MSNTFDKIFGLHEASLTVQSRRLQLLADNIANADTPGYKARDIDFRAAMQNAAAELQSGSASRQARAAGQPANGIRDYYTPLQYRTPLQADTGDQNSVDTQKEMAQFAQAAQQYQTSLTFVSHDIRSLMQVIKGE